MSKLQQPDPVGEGPSINKPYENALPIDTDTLYGYIEAILMVTETPVTPVAIAAAIDQPEQIVIDALTTLRREYAGERGNRQRGWVLRQVAGGWRIYSNPEFAIAAQRFISGNVSTRLSQAAIETLAIIAYKQPCTRAQVGAVRGVNVDSIVRNLAARGLIEEIGVAANGASIYGTTALLLEQLDLQSIDELPPLSPYMPSNVDFGELAAKYGEKTDKPDPETETD